MPRKALKSLKSIRLLPCLAFALLPAANGQRKVPEPGLEKGLVVLRLQDSEAKPAPDPQVKAVLDKMTAAGVARPSTVDDVRKAYLFYSKLSGSPEHVFRIADRQIPGADGNLPIRVYTPSSTSGLPIFVFFHGGGFVAGSLDIYDTPLRSVANRCQCIVVSVAYRLAPENKYPAAPDDAYSATKWVAEHGSDFGGDPHRIAVGGDGAGGNLAAVVALMARERGAPRLTFQLLIYPMLDASTVRPSWWAESNVPTVSREVKSEILGMYLPITGELNDPFVSPNRAKSLKNLPPALLLTYGGHNPMEVEGQEYVNRLTQDGVVAKISLYPDAMHGFFLMAGELDAGKKCIDETAAALRDAFRLETRARP